MARIERGTLIPDDALRAVADCPFADPEAVAALAFRNTPYWHTLLTSRHIGIYRPYQGVCTWTARILTRDKLYRQKSLGPALDLGRGSLGLHEAVGRAFEWFRSGEVAAFANEAKPTGRTESINVCPIGPVYTVGHALRDYTEWTRIARSPGGHYNNLILINHHIVPNFLSTAE